MLAGVPGLESHPADDAAPDEPLELLPRSPGSLHVAGFATGLLLASIAVVVGDQDWIGALGMAAGGLVGVGLVVGLGGTPVQRGMAALERVLPASGVTIAPPTRERAWMAAIYVALTGWFGVHRGDYAYAAVIFVGVAAIYAVEHRRVARLEGERRGRLAQVPLRGRERLRHPFRTPEFVLVVDDPARADAQAASSSSVARSGPPSK